MSDLPENPINDLHIAFDVELAGEHSGFHYVVLRRLYVPTKEEAEAAAKAALAKKLGVPEQEINLDDAFEVPADLAEKFDKTLGKKDQGEGGCGCGVSDMVPALPGGDADLPDKIVIERKPQIHYWVTVGTFEDPDPAFLKYCKTLLDQVPRGLSKIVYASGGFEAVPTYTCYVAVSTDNPVDREHEFAKMSPHARDEKLRERAERLASFLKEGCEFFQSFGSDVPSNDGKTGGGA